MSLNIPNLDKLIAHLEAQPPERINMAWAFFKKTPLYGECGCIIAHANEVFPGNHISPIFGDKRISDALFMPPHYYDEDEILQKRYPAHRVIATLKRLRDRFLATGEIVVDWGAEPGSEPAQPWAAPRAVEITPPALPETLTRLLTAQREEA